jgi:sporulation protein YlmC with PRC-barrel domain
MRFWMMAASLLVTFAAGPDLPFAPIGAHDLIGSKARDATGESAGEIKDFLVDLTAGRIAYVILAVPSGEYVPVPPDLVETTGKGRVLVRLQNSVLQNAPHFPREEWAEISSPESGERFYHYYGSAPIPLPGRYRTGQSAPALARGRVDMIGYGKLSRTSELLGMRMTNYKSETVGRLRDVILNLPRGEIAYAAVAAAISHGKVVAIPPQLIQRHTDQKSLILNVEKEKLVRALAIDPRHWPAIVNTAWGGQNGALISKMDPPQPLVQHEDFDLENRIKRALRADAKISPEGRGVQVVARDGVVTLRGTVKNDQDLQRVISEAERVAGKGRVLNQLESRNL